jgi:ankyrin repeat protein
VKRLLKRGADPEERDKYGKTALEVALERGCIEVVKVLAPVTRPTERTIMATGGDLALVSLLAFYWPEEVVRRGGEVLAWLVSIGRSDTAAMLLGLGAAPDRPWEGRTALHEAARRCDVEIARLLLSRGANVNKRNRWGGTPLHEAACPEVAELLIQHGAEINARDDDGKTPLHRLVYSPALVALLLRAGADPNARNKYGETPLHKAVWWCYVDVVAELLKYGADPNAPDARGDTPLHDARCPEVAQLLIQHGADPNARNKYGETPLHTVECRLGVAAVLLEHGADPNARDNWGRTPLHYAAHYGCVEVVELLIKAGADVNARDKYGETPLHKAYNMREYDVVKVLKRHGACMYGCGK